MPAQPVVCAQVPTVVGVRYVSIGQARRGDYAGARLERTQAGERRKGRRPRVAVRAMPAGRCENAKRSKPRARKQPRRAAAGRRAKTLRGRLSTSFLVSGRVIWRRPRRTSFRRPCVTRVGRFEALQEAGPAGQAGAAGSARSNSLPVTPRPLQCSRAPSERHRHPRV